MRRVLSFLFPLVVLVAAAMPLYAQPVTFNTGDTLRHSLSVCMEKQDALDILNARRDGGEEAAEKVWNERPKCGNGNVVGPKVGKVVYAVRADGETFSAVEVIWEGGVVGYFLTSAPVNKAQRNS